MIDTISRFIGFEGDVVVMPAEIVRHKHLPGKHNQQLHNPHKGMDVPKVWTGPPIEWSGKPLTKLEVGAIGEKLVMKLLSEQLGVPFTTLNEGINNAPIDVSGNHTAVEVKTGLASNNKASQHWRATIGQPGKAEAALIAQMTPEQKRIHNASKEQAIILRKYKLLEELSAMAGTEIRGLTAGVILHPDGTKADVYLFEGFHLRIPWSKAEELGTYLGSHDVD